MSHTVRRRKSHTSHQRGMRARAPTQHERGKRPTAAKPVKPVPVIKVTDHAILRWLERVTGIDVRAKVEADMLADGRAETVAKVVTGRIRIADTSTVLVIRDSAIVSVVIEAPRG